ncbi:hypothetical protein BLA29_006636 [Euroglyphus maynei]|uniref:Uncharacterized protein n=1 Tax=Euroglyphus maynei TaxID=6958 RepID=A0A1Y3BPC4_EURMA|nr:hypothetical protein BLA29_006636 [Euroglyphus maynei]
MEYPYFAFNNDIINIIKEIIHQLVGNDKPYRYYVPQDKSKKYLKPEEKASPKQPKHVIDNIKTSIELETFETGKLKTLMDRLIARYKPSKSTKFLSKESLEGMKPSQAWF